MNGLPWMIRCTLALPVFLLAGCATPVDTEEMRRLRRCAW